VQVKVDGLSTLEKIGDVADCLLLTEDSHHIANAEELEDSRAWPVVVFSALY
jgi:hypothetical protein